MIALSSHKPHHLSAEYARNQIAANRTWLNVFEDIYYFGPTELELSDERVHFVGQTDFPLIKDMLLMAGQQRQLVAILNADIVVSPKLRTIGNQMEQKRINAATSKRWQNNGLPEPVILDKGLDIFIARPWLWRILAKECPLGYRIGHCEWDTWCLGMLMRYTHRKMADFTEAACIFHPVHEGRERPHNGDVPKMPEWLYDYAKMPPVKLRL